MITVLSLLVFALSVLLARRFPMEYWSHQSGMNWDDWRDWIILAGIIGFLTASALFSYTLITTLWDKLT